IRTQNFGRAAARNDRLQSAAPFYSARHFVDQLPRCHFADFDFEIAGAFHAPAYTNDARAGIVRPTELRVFRSAHGDDVFHRAQRLDVVHDCRTHVESEHGRKVRRLDPWISTFAFERFDQAGFFAANISAGPTVNVYIDIEPGAENVFAEKVVLARLFDRAFEDLRAFRKLASYIYVR